MNALALRILSDSDRLVRMALMFRKVGARNAARYYIREARAKRELFFELVDCGDAR